MDFVNRLSTYNKDFCWQYNIRLNNLEEDLKLFLDEDPLYFEEDDEVNVPYESAMEP